MKTTKNVFTKLTQFTIVFLMICIQSCDTEIPAEDLDPPTFRFEIIGDGFSQIFDQDTDFESFQLNLREDAAYDFVFSAGDPDGMKLIQWHFASDYVQLETPVFSNWELSTTALQTFISWYGDEANPLTGNVISGTFRARGDNVGHSFHFMARDFGGTSSNENTTYGTLNVYSGNHNTEIIN